SCGYRVHRDAEAQWAGITAVGAVAVVEAAFRSADFAGAGRTGGRQSDGLVDVGLGRVGQVAAPIEAERPNFSLICRTLRAPPSARAISILAQHRSSRSRQPSSQLG